MALASGDVVLWYDMEEGTGSTLDNAEGTASRDGTQSGCTWVTGGPTNIPNGLDIVPGATDHISLNNTLNELVGTANDFSFSIWIKPDSFPNGAYLINDWGGSGSRSILWRLQSTGSGMQFYVSDNGTASELQISSTGYSTVNQHWVITRSGNNTEFIVNGVSIATNTGSFTLINSGQDILFGLNPALNDTSYDGKIFHLAMLNRAISATEAGEIFNSGDGATYDDLFGGAPPAGTPFSQAVVIM